MNAVYAQSSGPLVQPPGSKSIDERTAQKGAAATIEGSDIGGQDAGDVSLLIPRFQQLSSVDHHVQG